MRGSIIGERYARALLGIGIDRDNYEQIGRELDRVAALFQIEEVRQLFKNPKFDAATRKDVLNELLGEVTVSPVSRNFLFLLVDRNRIGNLPEIIASFHKLADDHGGKLRARVRVAQLLSDADIERLRAVLQKATGRQVIVQQEEDASIVGGVVTHIDGRVYDGSIKSQLDVLRARLKQSRA